jgi:uncharacterized protein YhaN
VKFIDVRAAGFGAMRNKSISFAPGFNLVYGPNEAGKSTWHAALYAAFCGMRRTRNETRSDEDFIRQYRPWDFPEPFAVSTHIELEDGRRIELQQELIERIECRATDVDGRDYTSDITNEGCPDGALWLGLDRRSFIATACIRQSQVLEVLNSPDILQTHLQRAAATCAVNSNGASALQLVEIFREEHIGEDRQNSTKPLPVALRRVESLKKALALARAEHVRYLELIATESRGKSRVEKLRAEWNLVRAIIADRDASEWERRLQRVLQIIAAHPERPTADLEAVIELARQVSTAHKVWQERPVLPDLSGATAAEIWAEIEQLPEMPTGELEPDPKVLKNEAELLASKYALTLHVQSKPPEPVMPDTKGLSSEQLKQLSNVLAEPEPEVDPSLEEVVRSTPVSERVIQRVHTAIDVWERRPTFSNTALVRIPPVEEIQRQIEELPVVTDGDLQPAREVLEAANRYSSSKEAIKQHGLNKPPDPVYPNVEGVTGSELRTLAQRLREPQSPVLDTNIWKRGSLNKELAALQKARTQAVIMTAIAGVGGLGASVYFLLGHLPILGGIAAVVVGLIVAVHVMKTSAITAKQKEIDNLAKQPDPATIAANAGPSRDLLNRLERLKLPANAEELDKMADQFDAAQVAEQMVTLWKETEKRIQAMSDKCASDLESALYGKVAGYVSNLDEALVQYQEECAERVRITSMATRREDLERQLAAKIEADASAAEIRKRQEEAGAEMRQVADLCDITAENDEELASKLQKFLNECERLKMMEKELGQHIFVRSAWKKRQAEATKQLQSVGLTPDHAAVRSLAEELDRAHLVKSTFDNWEAMFNRLDEDHENRMGQMRQMLTRKGMEVPEDIELGIRLYREGCENRAQMAVQARRRADLEKQLASRKQVEDAAAAIQIQRDNARQALLDAAARCEIPVADEVPLSESLLEWLSATSKTIRKHQEASEGWRELDTLLEGRTVKEFKEQAQQHRENALIAGSAFSGDELRVAMMSFEKHEARMPELTRELETAGQELANVQGQIHNYESRPTSVSDAEEELRVAEDELSRIRLLSDTLEATHAFLTQAKNRVFRDIAPFLADSVKKWLPTITLGRYLDARVDPSTLQVQVCDENGKWRQSAQLSYGTAEQVYLLLRLAMTEYLTAPNEICPLILDDITVQSDSRRKQRILETLKMVSEKRQVIIFSQEEQVYDWACENLQESDARIIDLVPHTVMAHSGNGRKVSQLVRKPVDAA